MAQELLIKMDSVKSSGMDWFYRMEALAKAVDNFVQVTFLCKSADDAGIQYLKSKDLSVMKYVDEADLDELWYELHMNCTCYGKQVAPPSVFCRYCMFQKRLYLDT